MIGWYKRKVFDVFILIILFASESVFASETIVLPVYTINSQQFLSEYDIRTSLPVQSSFDIVLQRGRIVRGKNYALYQVGMSIGISNGILLRAMYPVIRKEGEVLIPLEMGIPILRFLMYDYSVTIEGNRLVLALVPKEKFVPHVQPVTKDAIGFIVIDPGHGGKDPGAIGTGGIKEKEITLQIAKEVVRQLQMRLSDINIVLTRNDDTFLELGKRTEIANRMLKKGVNGIFVSIHCNAAVVSRVSGFETYFLSQNPSNEDARATAVLENNVIVFEEPDRRRQYTDVEFIEALMLTSQIQKESEMLANSIQKSLKECISEFKSKGVKKADFFVLRGSLMPSVLVEVGYITNPRERSYLMKKNYQKKLARGIANGIIRFIEMYNATVLSGIK